MYQFNPLEFYSQPKTSSDYLSMNTFGQQISPDSNGITGFDPSTLPPVVPQEVQKTPMFRTTDAKGNVQMGLADYGLGAIGSALNAYMGFKQLGMEKKKLAFAKQSHRDNFNAQANLTNANLSDRQTTRNIDGFGENAATYMAKYGVKNV